MHMNEQLPVVDQLSVSEPQFKAGDRVLIWALRNNSLYGTESDANATKVTILGDDLLLKRTAGFQWHYHCATDEGQLFLMDESHLQPTKNLSRPWPTSSMQIPQRKYTTGQILSLRNHYISAVILQVEDNSMLKMSHDRTRKEWIYQCRLDNGRTQWIAESNLEDRQSMRDIIKAEIKKVRK